MKYLQKKQLKKQKDQLKDKKLISKAGSKTSTAQAMINLAHDGDFEMMSAVK